MATEERDYSHRSAVQKLGVKPAQRVEITGDVGSGLRRDVKEAVGRGLVRSGELDGAIVLVESEAQGLEVTVAEPANAITFGVGAGDWLVSAPRDRHGEEVPVAASGGWLDDHTVRVEVIFLESPHRMDIACALPARTASASWRHTPLDGGRLQTLHRPR